MQRGWKLGSRKETYPQTPGSVRKAVSVITNVNFKINITYLVFSFFFIISKLTGGNEMEASNFFTV